nr:hypothetical protein [Tanacetum cinerariifolium]
SNDKENQDLRLSEEARIQEEEDADELYRSGKGLTTFCFEERLRSLKTSFSEYRQTNSFADAVSTIPGIVQHFLTQQMMEAVREVVQIQTDRLQDSLQRENDEFLRNIDENMKKIIMGQVKNQVKEQVSRILHRIEETPEGSEDEGNDKEDQNLRLSEEARIQEEEEADELYRDVDINQGRGLQTDRLQDSLQRENDEFLCNIDENIKKIIKGQVKSQVKEQVSRILPRIEESVNATLEAEVLTRSSNSSRTSYAIAADLSKMELKKILIEKMEGNKSIQRSDEQQNLYKALVEAYDADKAILDTYGESTILKRRREDDDQEGPFAGSNRGSTTGSQSRQLSASESAFAEEPSYPVFETGAEDQPSVQTSQHPEWFSQPRRPPSPDPAQGDAQSWISVLARQTDARSTFNELLDTPIDFSNFIMNRLGEPINYDRHAFWGVSHWGWKRQQFYGFAVNRESALDVYSKRRIIAVTELKIVEWHNYKHLDWISVRRDDDKIYKFKEGDFKRLRLQDIEDMLLLLVQGKLFNLAVEERFAFNVSLKMFTRSIVIQRRVEDLQLGRRIIAVTELKIVEWHNYKHLDWILVRRDDDKIYKFKEGDLKRLRLQDIEDMLLLLVQGKLSNLTVEERFAFNVSLRMFTKSIVIQRRVKDLQLGVESYQKRLNLTKPDTYRSDLKRREAYTAYSNPRVFIYQNKDKKNRLMWIDELHKFSDGTLNDVRNALDDRLKGIRMQYLPTTIWRRWDKDSASAMIQAIDKMLKTMRIMRSLEKFVKGRLYEGDFRMMQRTI